MIDDFVILVTVSVICMEAFISFPVVDVVIVGTVVRVDGFVGVFVVSVAILDVVVVVDVVA